MQSSVGFRRWFCIWLCLTVLQIKFECPQFVSIFVGVMPLLELRILKIQFSALVSYTLWHIALKFCIWIYFTLLQIRFECYQFASSFVGVMSLLELRILEIHKFTALFFYVLWHIELKFVIWLCLMYYRSISNVITLCLSGSPSLHLFSALSSYIHWQIYLKFKKKNDVGFFNLFLLEKYYIKLAFQNVHDVRIMHHFRCSGISFILLWEGFYV